VLETTGVRVRFGGVVAVDGVGVAVEPGGITGIIGPNGAGKTTLFNIMCGIQRPDQGAVRLGGHDVTDLSPAARSRLGLARTFQRLELFDLLTTRENVLVAAEALRRRARGRTRPGDIADEILGFVGLDDIAETRVDELPTGRARLVELARALATRPRVLLLDEPAAGLSDAETAELSRLLRRLVAGGQAVVVVEHDIAMVMSVCDQLYVLDCGRLIAAGRPEAIRSDPAVIDAYLGGGTS